MVKLKHLTIMERIRTEVLLNTGDYTYADYEVVSEVCHFLERRMTWQNGSQLDTPEVVAKLAMLSSSKERGLNGIDQALLTIKQHGSWTTVEIGDLESALLSWLRQS